MIQVVAQGVEDPWHGPGAHAHGRHGRAEETVRIQSPYFVPDQRSRTR